MSIVDYEIADDIAIVTLNNPPVNGLSLPLRRAFIDAIERARADAAVRAIILTGAGKGFCAGGDIREFGSPEATALPGVSSHMHPAVESSAKPVIAAIHGLAMGGGLETAMVCHYRIAMADAKIALPEVKIGTIPLSGTQRMPRLIGLQGAIDMIAGAQSFFARDFAGTRLFDRIVEPQEGTDAATQVRAAALAFTRTLLQQAQPALPLIRDLPLAEPDATAILVAARARYAGDPENPAPAQSIEAIAAGVEAPDFDSGIIAARKIWADLMASDQVRRLRDKFFAERRAKSS